MNANNRCLMSARPASQGEVGDKSLMKIIITIFIFLTATCSRVDEFTKIREGNFEIVEADTYRGTPMYMGQGGEYKDLVKSLRVNIEKNSDVLPLITKEFFPVSEKLLYRFKFAALDREKDYLILRYFARIVNHPIYAGYQIQFVFDIHSKQLVYVFTAEVPLE